MLGWLFGLGGGRRVGVAAVRMRRVTMRCLGRFRTRLQDALQRGGTQDAAVEWARIVQRLAEPKHAAMMGNVGAAARCRTVARRWRP